MANQPRLPDPGPFCDLPSCGIRAPRSSAEIVCNFYSLPWYLGCWLLQIHRAMIAPGAPKELYNDYLARKIGRSVSQVKRVLEKLEERGMVHRKFIRFIQPHKHQKTGKWIACKTYRTLTTVLTLKKRKPKSSPTRTEWVNASIKHNLGATLWFNLRLVRNPYGDGVDYAGEPYRDGSPGLRLLFPMGPEVQRFAGYVTKKNGEVVWI